MRKHKNKYKIYRFGVDTNFKEYDNHVGTYLATSEEDAINQHAEKTYDPDNREFMKGYLKAVESV